MLQKLLELQAEQQKAPIDRRLSILSAAFLLALTDQDRELVRLAAQGKTKREIGHIFGIQEAAVQKRAKILAKKLRVKLQMLERIGEEWIKYAA